MSLEQELHIKSLLKTLPDSPGVYQYFDKNGKILYVGKAKNLKKRVASYFQKKLHDSFKVKVLVEKIWDIKHIVVSSESDALLLENNLIKKLQPRYNILLKDDKTFPWICIKNENFPRVFLTRNVIQDGSRYYGPYTSAHTARTLLDLVRQLYPLRTCKHNLNPENVQGGKFKVCLEYHIKNCMGPCEGFQGESSYNESIEQIHNILKGNISELILYLKSEMKNYASDFKFEEAALLKNKIEALEKFQMKSTIVNPSINDVDVFSIVDEEKYAIVNYLKITKGAVVQSHTVEIVKRLNESTSEILRYAITDMQEKVRSESKNLILPFNLSEDLPWYKITVPQRGEKKKLLDLSLRNARLYKLEKQRRKNEQVKVFPGQRILETLKTDLRLKELPLHIECFDNSNIQGSNPVAACVVFRNAKPAKKDYRHFNIKNVSGPDDFASMEEVIFRRYKRLLDEKKGLPQLIVIDGGKGQLNAAVKSLDKLELRNKIAIIGIAKKLEEIYFPGDPVPLYIDKNSESLKIIQFLRNEAHRFGIEFHRLKRSDSMISSELEEIPGIGPQSIQKLFKHFKSMEAIRNASEKELASLLNTQKARVLKSHLQKKN